MKSWLASLVFLLSLTSTLVYADQLYLDFACKIKCITGEREVEYDQGSGRVAQQVEEAYIDYINLTRAKFDKKLPAQMNQICKSKFGAEAKGDSFDCIHIKH